MRILYLSPWFPYPLDTGSRIRVYHLVKALSQRHDVTLLTLDPQGWAPAQVDAVASLCDHAAIVPKDPFNRHWLRRALRFFIMRPVSADPFPEMVRMAQALHADNPFDVVISATTVMSTYALEMRGVIRVLEEHNALPRWAYERYLARESVLGRLRGWANWRKSTLYNKYLFRRFDLVTMVSEHDAEFSRSFLTDSGPPVDVFPNGVDCTTFRRGLVDPQPARLIFSGSLSYSANYEAMKFFLESIYPRIRERIPGVTLHITGKHTDVDLDELLLDESVVLTGFVQDVRLEIAAAQVAVVPILSGGGTRLKILEAMALGTPVVSTAKGAEGLAVVDREHLLLADDDTVFATRVVELLENASLRRELASNARRRVEERYDWAQIGADFVETIEHLVSGRTLRS